MGYVTWLTNEFMWISNNKYCLSGKVPWGATAPDRQLKFIKMSQKESKVPNFSHWGKSTGTSHSRLGGQIQYSCKKATPPRNTEIGV